MPAPSALASHDSKPGVIAASLGLLVLGTAFAWQLRAVSRISGREYEGFFHPAGLPGKKRNGCLPA